MFDVSSQRNGRMFGFDYTNRDGTPATLESLEGGKDLCLEGDKIIP
jgi:hypothetical protein